MSDRGLRRWRDALRSRSALAGTAGLYFAERLLSLGLNFLVLLAVARLHGPAEFGQFAYAWAIVQFVSIMLVAGIEPVMVRALVLDTGRRPAVLGSAAALLCGVLVVGLALLAPVLLEAPGSDSGAATRVGLVLAAGLLPLPLLVIEQTLRADRRADRVAKARISAALVTLLAKVSLLVADAPLHWLAVAFAAEMWLVAAFYVRDAAGSPIAPQRWSVDAGLVRSLGRALAPAAGSALVVTLFFRVNHLLLPRTQGYSALGQYALAMNVVQVFDTMLGALVSAAYPGMVSSGAAGSQDRLLAQVRQLARVFTAAAYGLLLLVLLLAPFVVVPLFGPGYAQVPQILAVLAIAAVCTSSALARAQFLNARGWQTYHLWNALIGLAVLVPTSLWATAAFGAIGAAWAHAAGCAAAGLLATFVFRGTRPVGWIQVRALALR